MQQVLRWKYYSTMHFGSWINLNIISIYYLNFCENKFIKDLCQRLIFSLDLFHIKQIISKCLTSIYWSNDRLLPQWGPNTRAEFLKGVDVWSRKIFQRLRKIWVFKRTNAEITTVLHFLWSFYFSFLVFSPICLRKTLEQKYWSRRVTKVFVE